HARNERAAHGRVRLQREPPPAKRGHHEERTYPPPERAPSRRVEADDSPAVANWSEPADPGQDDVILVARCRDHFVWDVAKSSSHCLVTSARFGLSSTPANRMPSRSAHLAVMPLPQHGSKTIAPGRATLESTWCVMATPDMSVGSHGAPGPEYQSMFGRFGLPYKQRQRARSWSPRRAMASASSSTHRSPISTNTCARGAFTAATTSQKVSRNRAQSGRTDSPLWV